MFLAGCAIMLLMIPLRLYTALLYPPLILMTAVASGIWWVIMWASIFAAAILWRILWKMHTRLTGRYRDYAKAMQWTGPARKSATGTK